MRRKAKRDTSEAPIIIALRMVGATVHQVNDPGLPDLLVGFRGETFLLEVKTKKWSKFTPLQDEFMEGWRGGTVAKVRTVDEALIAIGAVSS